LALGQGEPALRALHTEMATATANPHIGELQRRMQALQEASNAIAQQLGLPSWQIEIGNLPHGQEGLYQHGQNRIILSLHDVLSAEGVGNLEQALREEISHRAQDMLIVRHLAQQLSGQGVDVSSSNGMNRLVESFQTSTGFRLSPEFARQILQQFGSTPLSASEMVTAIELASSLRTYRTQSAIISDRIGIIGTEIASLRMSPDRWDSFLEEISRP